MFQSLDEANRQRAIEVSADINEAVSGSGYTSIRDICQDEGVEVGPAAPSRARCTFLGQVFTPADLLGQSAAATIDNELGWLTTSDELSEAVVGIVGALISSLSNLAISGPISDTPGNDGSAAYLACVKACGPLVGTSDPNAYGYCVQQCSPELNTGPGPGSEDGGGGTGVCRDTGTGTANYTGALQSAIDAVIANNPNGIADASNTTANSLAFLDFVVQELQSAGFNATTNVLNGNDNPNSGDLIAVWQNGDSKIERYDAIVSVGAGDRPLRDAATSSGFTGDIPLSCSP